jgi:membrane AbrB-like protein
VIFVSIAAAAIARLWVGTSGVAAPAVVWFPPIEWPAFAATIAVAAIGGVAGRLARLPAGTFLGPMILGTALHLGADVDLQLPQWLLAASYALIGWSIGLNFTRTILRHAARALPQIIASIVALIGFCAALGFAMSRMLGIDPLTAYLATSPGGMDSVAIIAAASNRVDLSFVMALQTARFLIVLLAGPSLARLLARRVSA